MIGQKVKKYGIFQDETHKTFNKNSFESEFDIVDPYKTLNSLKENLSERDCLIHTTDLSENYQTKYFKKIQSLHFGGSLKWWNAHNRMFSAPLQLI